MWGAMYPERERPRGARCARSRCAAAWSPAAAGLLNAAGLGPFGTEMTGPALRRAGIAAMCRVVERLGIDADWVIYGHTHRAGPLPGEGDWRAPTGARLMNCGALDVGAAARRAAARAGPLLAGAAWSSWTTTGRRGSSRVLEDVPESEMPLPLG